MNSRARSSLGSWIGRGAAALGVILAGACNALVGLDDLEHVLPSEDSGALCSDPAVDCPSSGSACKVPVCVVDGSCGVENAAPKTECAEGGGGMCNAAGECVECIEDIDCGAPLTCGGGGVPGACGCESPCHVWSQLFDGMHEMMDNSSASMMAVRSDTGTIFITGWFGGTFELGKHTLTSAGGNDAFLAKIDPNGSVLWTKSFGDPTEQLGFGVAATKDGGVLWTGAFQGTMIIDETTVTSMGGRDAFVAKYTSDGALVWLKTSTGDMGIGAEQLGIRVVEDVEGNVIVLGHFQGGLNFGDPKTGSDPMDAGAVDLFIVKFGPDGVHQWTKVFGDAKTQRAPGFATDAMGNILVAGVFNGTVDFGGGAVTEQGTVGEDIFVVKLDPTGAYQWAKYYGNDKNQVVSSLHVDKNGGVLVAGELAGTLDFGPGPFTSADKDAYVLKLHGDGSYAWSRRFGSDGKEQGAFSAVDDGSGGVMVAGRFSGNVDFGVGPMESKSGLDSVFFLKLDATSGDTVWSRAYGTAGASHPRGLELDNDGHAILFGSANGTIDFGGGPLVSTGANSLFLTKFKL